MQSLEDQRDKLNSESNALALQSDTRANLRHDQKELKSKNAEIQQMWVPI